MVPEKTRNTIVGITMIAALAVLMYGVIMISKPGFGSRRPYTVTLLAPNANGANPGAKVDLNGVNVGQVKSLALESDAKGTLQARIILQIDGKTDVPANAAAYIGKSNLGTPYVSLAASDARGPKLPKDGTAVVNASAGDTGLIPKDVRDNLTSVASQLGIVAKDLHTLLAYNTPEDIEAATQSATQPGAATQPRPVENVATLIVRLNRTMKSLEVLLTDPQLQGDVRKIVQNLRDASEKLNGTLVNVDTTVKNADKAFSSIGDITTHATKTLDATQVQIIRVSEKLVEMLGQIEKTTKELAEGNGTTGKMINDPRLYEGLVDLSKTMRTTVDDLDFLLKKWKDEGVNLKLK